MDRATFEALGLDRSLDWETTVNGRRNVDIFHQRQSPGDDAYHPCPEAFPAADVMRSTVLETLDWPSSVFAGTKRDIAITVPAKLAGSSEAPAVLVFNDGPMYRDPARGVRADAVIDSLMHQGEIPLTVGVFVQPGRPLGGPSARDEQPGVANFDALNRRSVEYDSLTDDYPRFLVEDLLPFVEKQLGRPLQTEPALRAVCGVSSGGIAAFNAAWHRPGSFGGVISHCGSFTNIRGGHNYPYIVRSTARKPIRVWMQSGENDADIPWGNWPRANREMAGSLQYAGYDVHFEFGTGSHGLRHGGSLFAAALRWLWSDATGSRL